MNHFFSYLIFIVYYVATPGLQILIYATYHKDYNILTRIYFIILVITIDLAVIMMNVMSIWITTYAHKPYNLLYSYLTQSRLTIPVKHRLKIQTFIERLSGPDIGFYCYDLFPMNNYEFYQYVYISGLNYFLLISFF